MDARERGDLERIEARAKDRIYPLSLILWPFRRIPLLPRNCKSHESRSRATAETSKREKGKGSKNIL
jgi:hypothetical protein